MLCKKRLARYVVEKRNAILQGVIEFMVSNREVFSKTEHVLSLSYGKDSIACIEAIKQLGLPLDRIVHAEVWATDTIPADLPPMVEFKAHVDKIIKNRYGLTVEHIYAKSKGTLEKLTYESIFYRPLKKRKVEREREDLRFSNAQRQLVYERPKTTGFATKWSQYCTGELKIKSFQTAPLHKELIQILCNILASLRTNPSALNGIQNLALSYHWYKSAGTKPTAGSGARTMICCRRYTPPLRGAGAGFATAKALTSCAYCAKTTPTCGRCC